MNANRLLGSAQHFYGVGVHHFTFTIRITSEGWSEYYRVPSASIVARSHTGKQVQFKARHLHKFITRDGIQGTFRMTIDDNQDFVSMEKL